MGTHDTAGFSLVDLHVHSLHSDGTLAPAAVVAEAARRRLSVLALTDHDTTGGCAEAAYACRAQGIGFLAGAELTCHWREREIHVVGLGVDTSSEALQSHLAATRTARHERIRAIDARLQRLPALQGRGLLESLPEGCEVPTRLHLARALVQRGLAGGVQAAFDRYLGRGTPGHVPASWAALEDAVAAIRCAGGRAVLAHAHRYRLSNGQLGQLCQSFREAGGDGLEVSIAGTSPNDTARLLQHARRNGLAGSIASDFHEPGIPWRPLGRLDKLPDGITPILTLLQPA